MRRASRFAAFSGDNIVTPEFAEHHALQEQQEQKARRRRPRHQTPQSMPHARKGLLDFGDPLAGLNQLRPRPPRVLKVESADSEVITSEASYEIKGQEALPESTASHLASQSYSSPQDVPTATMPELQNASEPSVSEMLVSDSGAVSEPSHAAVVPPEPSISEASGVGMPETEASASEHATSTWAPEETMQRPYVGSYVQQSAAPEQEVAAQDQARNDVQQPAAASKPQAIFEDLQVGPCEEVAANMSEKQSLLRMPNLHVDVSQSPLLREPAQHSEVTKPAESAVPQEAEPPTEVVRPDTLTADAGVTTVNVLPPTEAPKSADLSLSTVPTATPARTPTEALAPKQVPEHVEKVTLEATKPVATASRERGRLQAVHGAVTEDSALLRTPVQTKINQSVLEAAKVELADTYQPSTVGEGLLHRAQKIMAAQVSESAMETATPSSVQSADTEVMPPKKKAATIRFAPFAFAANPTGVAKPRKFDQLFPHSTPVAQQSKKSLLKAARTQLGTGTTSSLLSGTSVLPHSAVVPEGGLNANPAPPAVSLLQKHNDSPDSPLLQVQRTTMEQPTRMEQARSIEQASSMEQPTNIQQPTLVEPESVGEQRKLDLSQLGQTGSSLLRSRELPSFLKDGPTPPPRAASSSYPDREVWSQEQSRHRQPRFQQQRDRDYQDRNYQDRNYRDRNFQDSNFQDRNFQDRNVQDVPQHTNQDFQPAATQLSAMDMFKKMVQVSSKGSANTRKKSQRQASQVQQRQKSQPVVAQAVTITDAMTVRDLAVALHISPAALDSKLVEMGEMVESEEDIVSTDAAELVALELGFECTIQTSDAGTDVRPRPPVVTIVGHVDHGKTTLLDCLRNSHVAEGEAGGITQHVGAFSVTMPGTSSKITFLDTPGHAAFSAMRARGTRVTDIAVLVVAADDGVMQTTREAIQHVKDANCSLIVALTKCDRNGARPESIEAELLGEGLELESAGGNVQVVHTAAPKGIGLTELEEAILLQAEMLGVSAAVDTLPEASVVESHVDRGQGPVATVVVRQGVLKVGQPVVVGKEHGRVRSLHDPEGASVAQATPGVPVVVAGLKGVPHAGDVLRATSSESRARDIAEARAARAQTRHHAAMEKLSQDHFDTVLDEETGTAKRVMKPSLPLMLYADVDGSLEALTTSLLAVNTGRIVYKVVSADVGPPSSRDVQTAMDTGACVVCFGVSVPNTVQRDADQRGVRTVQSDVIYKLLDSLSDQLVASAPRIEERVTAGEVEVAATFHASVKKSVSATGKVKIAGCKVLDGRIRRDAVLVRVKRMGQVMWEGKIRELKQAKNNVDQVGKGSECGIMLSGWEDFQVGDKLEVLEMQAAKPKLSSTASGAVRIEG